MEFEPKFEIIIAIRKDVYSRILFKFHTDHFEYYRYFFYLRDRRKRLFINKFHYMVTISIKAQFNPLKLKFERRGQAFFQLNNNFVSRSS